ncbi:MAG: protein kinase [Haloarculaceae archaeon]
MSAQPETGDLVADRYKLEEPVGEGGFARAYRALDVHSGGTVAVKYPNYEGSSNDADVIEQYFLKEAETLEKIRAAGGHPNVMDLIERGDDGGTPVLVVEFVDGYELDEALDAVGTATDDEQVREVGIGLADAMSFLHENEIVYRDLKPDNVMLTEPEGDEVARPVLIDFNTATGFQGGAAEDSSTTILGPYKPPEVTDASGFDGHQGPWSDVYSIGKILLFLLRGNVPKMDGVDPRDFGADCAPYLAEIVERATTADPDERYSNATVLRDVLERRDAEPPARATLKHVQGDRTHEIEPGATIGRAGAAGPRASITVADPQGEHISSVQVQFDTDPDGDWVLRDRSVNGTYVFRDGRWQRVLCDAGRQRLRDGAKDPTDQHGDAPPESLRLSDGDIIALVDQTYGVSFEFRED